MTDADTPAPTPIDTPEAFFEAAKPLEEIVEVRGVAVRVVEPDWVTMRALVEKKGDGGVAGDTELLVACCRTSDGRPLFTTPEHAERMRASSWDAITDLLLAAKRVTGLSAREVERRVGESDADASSGSSTA